MKRNEFLKATGITAAALVLNPSKNLFSNNSVDVKIKVAIIGVGLRGQNHLDLLLRRDDVELVAISDINERMLTSSKEMINKSGKKMPQIFTGDDYAWKKMLEIKGGIDAVVIATPWEWHKQMIIGSLETGIKYVGTEVMLGITLQDHWDVVKAAEKYNAHVMMLENVCYRRDVMAVLNMVRQGIFGELIHLQGGYQHDLREVKFNDGVKAYGGGCEFGENAIPRPFAESFK